MNQRIIFTHRGWFGPCPVYLADLHTGEPIITPRWPWADVLLHTWSAACNTWERLLWKIDPGADLQITFWLVREMAQPIVADREHGG